MATSIIYGDVRITFPVDTVFNDTIQLILDIQYGSSFGTPTEYDSSDLGLSIKQYGELNLVYELDQFLLVPADVNLVLNDSTGVLSDHLMTDDFDNMILKASIKINGVSDFNGSMVDDSLRNDEGDKTLSFTFSSDSNKANEVTLYNADNESLNPLGLTLVNYSSVTENEDDALTRIDLFLEKIFQLVDPDIDFELQHDWHFGGITPANRPRVFPYIYVNHNTFFNDSNSERLLGDLLRTIAKTFFAQAVIPSNSKAYFRKLYYYNSFNLQTVDVLNRIRGYKYHKIKYTNSKNTFGTLDGAVIFEHPSPSDYTEVPEDFISYAHAWDAYFMEDLTFSGDYESVKYVKDPLYDGETQEFYDWMEIVSKLMYYYRSKTYYNRADTFKMKGVNYDYTKNFNYDGSKYQILSMKKYLSNGYTEIEALYLGDV